MQRSCPARLSQKAAGVNEIAQQFQNGVQGFGGRKFKTAPVRTQLNNQLGNSSRVRRFDAPAKAFTLAEVLITLSIIGVVAAMTMPTLIGKYNKMVWTNQLKKSYSTVSQGFQKMLADESAPDILSTSFVSERESLGKYLKTLNITNGDRNNAIAYYMENASGKGRDFQV